MGQVRSTTRLIGLQKLRILGYRGNGLDRSDMKGPPVPEVGSMTGADPYPLSGKDMVDAAKRRMLEWDNPVEFVNNMYGCHPDDGDGKGKEYFKTVFAPVPA